MVLIASDRLAAKAALETDSDSGEDGDIVIDFMRG